MKCPYCGFTDSRVLDTRTADEGDRIRRRRECNSCQKRFTTYEMVETTPLMVVKKDGSIEGFSREKLLGSLLKSCEKRQVSVSELQQAAIDIESTLRNNLKDEVPTSEIGELAMEKLKGIDPAAYIRFASVYRQFKDMNSFMEEIQKLLQEN